ncbi:MAG: hypothetical protein F6K56_24025, partial [Moorea sp. SIO3G5]|nr:hypothetical protein [Moorena sp. SIO3G5]
MWGGWGDGEMGRWGRFLLDLLQKYYSDSVCVNSCPLFPVPVLMQSLMGETTAVAHGGNPQDRAAS